MNRHGLVHLPGERELLLSGAVAELDYEEELDLIVRRGALFR